MTMSVPPTTGLYWFTRDLRLTDMPALRKLNAQVDQLVLVYCCEPAWFEQNQFGVTSMGTHRWEFVLQGLAELQARLRIMGQHLHIIEANPAPCIIQLCQQLAITHIGYSPQAGVYERSMCTELKQRMPNVTWHHGHGNTLFDEDDLPDPFNAMKNNFTAWRKQLEQPGRLGKHIPKMPPADENSCNDNSQPTLTRIPECQISALKPPPRNPQMALLSAIKTTHLQPAKTSSLSCKATDDQWIGGEQVGLAQLERYLFGTHYVARYKETRNELQGWQHSSKLSAWLAQGMVSSRTIAAQLYRYEQQVLRNESTYWLYFELLWREFFHWQLMKHGRSFFAAGGFSSSQGYGEHSPVIIKQWQTGRTGCDIVDAAMRQLNHTGFMSNRARQLCASFFIHELGQHWRYGAAYFEQQLIDYDVASNWGNWLYLAGKGNDPRGIRKFDIARQTSIYDPHRVFINTWISC